MYYTQLSLIKYTYVTRSINKASLQDLQEGKLLFPEEPQESGAQDRAQKVLQMVQEDDSAQGRQKIIKLKIPQARGFYFVCGPTPTRTGNSGFGDRRFTIETMGPTKRNIAQNLFIINPIILNADRR